MDRIFLCHASEDKPQVEEIYQRLQGLGFQPWMDKKDLLPGQSWDIEITDALKAADFILIFLSRNSVAKRGYVQREFKLALDSLTEIPEGMIHTIPVRLDNCDVHAQFIPAQLKKLQWGDLFDESGFEKVVQAIRKGLSQRQRPAPEVQSRPLELGPNGVTLNKWRDSIVRHRLTQTRADFVETPLIKDLSQEIISSGTTAARHYLLVGDIASGKTTTALGIAQRFAAAGRHDVIVLPLGHTFSLFRGWSRESSCRELVQLLRSTPNPKNPSLVIIEDAHEREEAEALLWTDETLDMSRYSLLMSTRVSGTKDLIRRVTSAPSSLNFGVEPLQFHAGVFDAQLPVDAASPKISNPTS